jgi:hypothetical protein
MTSSTPALYGTPPSVVLRVENFRFGMDRMLCLTEFEHALEQAPREVEPACSDAISYGTALCLVARRETLADNDATESFWRSPCRHEQPRTRHPTRS